MAHSGFRFASSALFSLQGSCPSNEVYKECWFATVLLACKLDIVTSGNRILTFIEVSLCATRKDEALDSANGVRLRRVCQRVGIRM